MKKGAFSTPFFMGLDEVVTEIKTRRPAKGW